ncbi:MAG: hypothetical protein RR555_00975 [Bacteroidales bacterium]
MQNTTMVVGLGNAFVNSTQTMADYEMAEQKAIEMSYPNIGILFRAAATMEEVHMQKLKALYADFTKSQSAINKFDTLQNIRKYDRGMSMAFLLDSTKHVIPYFMGIQSYQVNDLYASLAAQAETANNPELAKMYLWFMDSESGAYKLFMDAYTNFAYSQDFVTQYNVCLRCGSIYPSDDQIQYCTVCQESATNFIAVK